MIKVRSKLLRVYIATQLLYKCLARELFMRRKLTFKSGAEGRGRGEEEGKKALISHIFFIKIGFNNIIEYHSINLNSFVFSIIILNCYVINIVITPYDAIIDIII